MDIVIHKNDPQVTTFQYWIEVEGMNAWFIVERCVVDADGEATVEWRYEIEWWMKRHWVSKKLRAREPDIIDHCRKLIGHETESTERNSNPGGL